MKAKKNFIIIFFISSIFISYSFIHISNVKNNSMFISNNTPDTEILGVWYRENDPTDRIEFLNNGQVKRYFDNQLQYTDLYSITNSCDGETLSNQLFLKTIDSEDGTITCDLINGINENNSGILSLTTSDQGKVIIYIR